MALAVLRPRTRGARHRPLRAADVGLRDGPRASLRRPRGAAPAPARSATRSSPTACSALGELPNVRAPAALQRPGGVTAPRPLALGRPLGLVHGAARRAADRAGAPPRPRSPRGAPDGGHLRPRLRRSTSRSRRRRRGGRRSRATSTRPVRRIMVDAGEQVWRRAWEPLYDRFNGNPWAAMPSLHFATSLMAAIQLAESRAGRRAPPAGPTRRRSASPSSTSASTTSPIWSPAPPWWRSSAAASRSPSPLVEAVNRVLRRARARSPPRRLT